MTANKSGLWRYRVGDYWLACDIQELELVLLVLQVAPRSELSR
jgi:mRNA interferase RelE/StbE